MQYYPVFPYSYPYEQDKVLITWQEYIRIFMKKFNEIGTFGTELSYIYFQEFFSDMIEEMKEKENSEEFRKFLKLHYENENKESINNFYKYLLILACKDEITEEIEVSKYLN